MFLYIWNYRGNVKGTDPRKSLIPLQDNLCPHSLGLGHGVGHSSWMVGNANHGHHPRILLLLVFVLGLGEPDRELFRR
jgi:hypothetical protein